MVVATPDHRHAGIALAAMDVSQHVYVEKPLCWSAAGGAPARETCGRDEGRDTAGDDRRWNGPGITAHFGAALAGHHPVPGGVSQ